MEARRDGLEQCKSILDVLKVMKVTDFTECMLNFMSSNTFVTLPVTAASCERSFSKLIIVNNKLRSTMSEDRFQSLLILFVENDITKKIGIAPVIEIFALMKSRRMNLL